MGKQLASVAKELKNKKKKVQLVYAFNGVGKTRLSCAFKQLFRQGSTAKEIEEEHKEILYYNAFTEDLFYWDNDLENDLEMKMKIQSNSFTDWIYKDEGKDKDIQELFSRYTNSKAEANYDPYFTEVSFLIPGTEGCIKISKSEESCFIWCVFFSLLSAIVSDMNDAKKNNTVSQFKDLKYVFIDDPVTSLDDNHLIELAVNLSHLIKEAPDDINFIITTHNTLFYNVLHNQIRSLCKKEDVFFCFLRKNDDNSYDLMSYKQETPFLYHIYLLSEIKQAIDSDKLKKYHLMFMRNILEKISVFTGNESWSFPFKEKQRQFLRQVINSSSHSNSNGEEVSNMIPSDKKRLKDIYDSLVKTFHFNVPGPFNGGKLPQSKTKNK